MKLFCFFLYEYGLLFPPTGRTFLVSMTGFFFMVGMIYFPEIELLEELCFIVALNSGGMLWYVDFFFFPFITLLPPNPEPTVLPIKSGDLVPYIFGNIWGLDRWDKLIKSSPESEWNVVSLLANICFKSGKLVFVDFFLLIFIPLPCFYVSASDP